MNKFPPHGETTVYKQKNIIYVHINGAFNELGVNIIADKVRAIVQNLEGEAFSILVNETNSEGGTPEAYEKLNEYNNWLIKQNLVAKAVVYGSKTLLNIYRSRISSKNIQFFTDEKSAENWLKIFEF